MIRPRITIKDIALIGLCSAILVAAQVVLSLLPNIELVSLLVILYTRNLKGRTVYIIYVFALLQGLIYGFHIWWVTYLYVWTILFLIARALGDMDNALAWAIVSGLFGLCFGALTTIPYLFVLGPAGALAYFMSGALFDLVHCGGNFLAALLLYNPLNSVLQKAMRQYVL